MCDLNRIKNYLCASFPPISNAFHRALYRSQLSWLRPSTCVLATKQGYLAPVQKGACKRNVALMPVVVSASRRIIESCQNVFQRQRWNCSSVETAPAFQPDLSQGTREQAFVSSLAAAGLAVGVSRACAEGRVKTCGCGRTGRDPPPDDFSWGGCGDNVGYGVKAAKAFTSEPFDRRKFRAHSDVRLHRHNSRVGWRAVRSSWRLQCKCHGVSGSCELKTCWRSLPPLTEIALKLKLKHRDAEEVHPKSVGGRRRTKLLPLSARFNKDDLIYTVKSPDYCVYDPKSGSAGTVGRICNASATDSFSCETMCCGRGHLTTWVEREDLCACKYHWCCYVTCDKCTERSHLNICL